MPKGVVSPSAKAEEIIERLLIREPSEIHLREIGIELGAFVKERRLEGSEARLIRKGNLGIITVNSMIPEEGRKRFAVAHELGHFELHHSSQLILCTEKDMLIWNESKRQEIEANEFAASLLMPRVIFSRYIKTEPPNINIVGDIAKIFRTTLTATALRFVQLSTEPCAVALSKDGNIKWYKKSASFDFHIKVGEKLSSDSLAFDFYDGVHLPNQSQRVPAYSWLAGDIDEESEIFEHSLAFPNYNSVLSLLWIFSEIRLGSSRRDEDEPEFDLTNPFTPDGKRWRW
jgi:Zn-dependent peptidase ImmA (M78 family)